MNFVSQLFSLLLIIMLDSSFIWSYFYIISKCKLLSLNTHRSGFKSSKKSSRFQFLCKQLESLSLSLTPSLQQHQGLKYSCGAYLGAFFSATHEQYLFVETDSGNSGNPTNEVLSWHISVFLMEGMSSPVNPTEVTKEERNAFLFTS